MFGLEWTTFKKLTPWDSAQARKEVAPIMLADEMFHAGFVNDENSVVFTDKRMMFVWSGGWGKRKRVTTVPYTSIAAFRVEFEDSFRGKPKLQLFEKSEHHLEIEFDDSVDLAGLSRLVSSFVV